MKYDSLLNSKKWPSDSPKGSATPCFLPTLSEVLLCLLPNHPFSNLDFSGLGQPIFLKFVLVSPNGLNLTTDPHFLKIYLIQYLSDHIKLCVILWLSGLAWPLPRDLYIWGWFSVISVRRAGYHTSFERACSVLSYEPKYSKHSPVDIYT